MNRLLVVALLLLAAPTSKAWDDKRIVARNVPITNTLPGSAYLMSRGPAVKAEARPEDLEDDKLREVHRHGFRMLRVTLFNTEGYFSLCVDQIFKYHAGLTRIESCWQLSTLAGELPKCCMPNTIKWIDENTFELVEDPLIAIYEYRSWPSRRADIPSVRVIYCGSGEFEVRSGIESKLE